MSVKEFTKSGAFVLVLLGAVLLGAPFAIEQIGETTDFYHFPASKWVKGLFSSEDAKAGQNEADKKVDWEKQVADLKAFSEWAEGRSTAKIQILRPDEFQLERAAATPTKSSRLTWNLLLLSGTLQVNATQIRSKLRLFCEPEDLQAAAKITSVEPLSGDKKGFLVTVEGVRGEGKVGLSYAALPPVYYDVQSLRLWLVPIASCRSAMKRSSQEKGGYDAAVFFPGMEKGLSEGDSISPSEKKCGYRILSISDHCVWFEAFYENEPPEDVLPHSVWPDFSRVDTMPPTPPPGRLIFGRNRCFWPGDAIKLPNSGLYLMVDDFLAGRAVVFRLLDSAMLPKRELLCVIVHEK